MQTARAHTSMIFAPRMSPDVRGSTEMNHGVVTMQVRQWCDREHCAIRGRGVLLIILWLMLVVAVSRQTSVAGTLPGSFEFEVEGTVEFQAFNSADGSLAFASKKLFVLSVRDRCWFLKSTPAQPTTMVDCQIGCDGTNNYKLTTVVSKSKERQFTRVGIIDPGVVPLTDYADAHVVWSAYCSSAWFRERADATARPPWGLGDDMLWYLDYNVPIDMRRSDSPPGIPISISYYSDGHRVSLKDPLTIKRERLPKPYENGFLAAKYSVLSTTNIGGLLLPIEFKLERFIEKAGATTSNEVFLVSITRGQSMVFRPVCARPTFLPDIPAGTTVVDHRVKKSNPPVPYLRYDLSQPGWPSLASPPLREQYETMVRSRRLVDGPRPRTGAWIAAFVAVSFGFVLAGRILFVRGKSNNTKAETI